MRRYTFNARHAFLTIIATLVGSVAVSAPAAQAVVVNDGGTLAGVSLVPSSRESSLPSGVSVVTSPGPCTDPWLALDLGGPAIPTGGLCSRGGAVMHKNEAFALTWDQHRAYWSQTRGYVEQFLRDVADATGALGSPYAVTAQYSDGGGRARNTSIFGGGCIDYGVVGHSACEFGNPTGAGHDYPPNGCTPGGASFIDLGAVAYNNVCLTDLQLQDEVSNMVTQTGILGRTQPGYTPVVTLLMPLGVETCLDNASTLCSANGNLTPPPPQFSTTDTGGNITAGGYGVKVTYVTSGGESAPSSSQGITTTGGTSTITITSPPPAIGVTGWYAYITQPDGLVYERQQGSPTPIGTDYTLTDPPGQTGVQPPNPPAFCSYHSQVNVNGTEVPYVVQPWTVGTGCDEPGIQNFPDDPTPQQLSVGVGARLVSPLSQAEIAGIVNPFLNGWAALDGSEIQDNHACTPLSKGLDSVTVGSSSQNPYFLQREFNNAGLLEFDPATYGYCAPVVDLSAAFVVPSAVDQGDVVQFDGSATPSTLVVPYAGYAWNFGDGTTATGPSVVHSYATGGTYSVTLTVTDRGGNTSSLKQQITVHGSPPPPPPTGLRVRLQLMPQGLRSVLSGGMIVRVTSNQAANGIASLSIPRSAAQRAHIKVGRSGSVVIGRGTVAGIKKGTVRLRLRLSKTVVAKLRRLTHLTFTVRLALVGSAGGHVAVDVAGRY